MEKNQNELFGQPNKITNITQFQKWDSDLELAASRLLWLYQTRSAKTDKQKETKDSKVTSPIKNIHGQSYEQFRISCLEAIYVLG